MLIIFTLYIIFYIASLVLLTFLIFLIYFYDKDFEEEVEFKGRPSVNLYVPCKENFKYFQKNIKSILKQNYSNLETYFIVSSKKDGAYPILLNMIKKNKILIAEESKSCSQKNNKLMFGIQNSRKSEIYTFFDSDIYFERDAVLKLVRALSKNRNSVATSFPKKQFINSNIADTVYHFYYGFQYTLCSYYKGVWGGYFAIFAENFKKLNIMKMWNKSVSDDVPLTKLLIDKKIKVNFLKDVKIFDNNVHGSVGTAFSWVKRQTLLIKHYIKRFWLYYELLIVFILINLVLMVVNVSQQYFLKIILNVGRLFFLFYILHAMNKTLNKNVRLVDDLIFFIPAMIVIFASMLSALFSRDIVWGKYRYTISKGVVKRIISKR